MRTAVYAGTRNLYSDMIPAAKSLLINSNVEKIYFLIEDDKFPEPLPDCFECINAQRQVIFKPDGPNFRKKWTYMVLMRAGLTKLLPDCDKVLSLDVDTIVDRDISELWDKNIDYHLYAAVPETKKSVNGRPYGNMGVVIFNLKKLRSENADERIIRELNSRAYPFAEQDCINALYYRSMCRLSSEYNANAYTEPCENPKIIHYANVKNWNELPLVQKYRDISWEEIRGGMKCVI